MKATQAHIRNFRLLEDATIALDGSATMIVGRNNSGKTSVVEIFRKLVRDDSSSFSLDDLSLSAHARFEQGLEAFDRREEALRIGDSDAAGAAEDLARDLPAIELTLTIEYDEDDDLATLAPFILDLDPDRSDATIVFRTWVKDPVGMFAAYRDANGKKPVALARYLRKHFRSHTSSIVEAIDVGDPTNRKVVSDADLNRLLSVKFIYAQNQIDDLASDSGHRLSKGFESFYRANQADSDIAEKIEQLLEGAGQELDGQYETLFESIYNDLEVFGVGRMPGLPKLSVVSQLEAVRVLTGNAHLYYRGEGQSAQLPEAHNGLGYSKLIFTILQFISFYEELKRMNPRPPIQLIFVEEPEAHLHPQMQYVFVKSIRSFVASKSDWNAQTIITTHSSHMVAESGFNCIRYFDNSVAPLQVRDLSEFQTNLGKSDAGRAALEFLQQYMVLDRCDMFFADKLILIEGTVERLILPQMIDRVAPDLLHQYVSVIEVGGAYAHLFKGIIEFLNVQTLIITDIDSIDPRDHRRAAKVASGLVTSNQTLAKWLPAEDEIDRLLDEMTNKTSGRISVTYQIPEDAGRATGRSFEEAFILANAEVIAAQDGLATRSAFLFGDGAMRSGADIYRDSWEVSRAIDKKTDFAFDILRMPGWEVPRYIREGLEWLDKTP